MLFRSPFSPGALRAAAGRAPGSGTVLVATEWTCRREGPPKPSRTSNPVTEGGSWLVRVHPWSFFSGAPVLRPAVDPKRRRPLPIWLAGRRYRGASNLVMAWRVAGAMLCQGSVPPFRGVWLVLGDLVVLFGWVWW